MANFIDNVEKLLRVKTDNQLREFILNLAYRTAEDEQEKFLTLLINQKINIQKDIKSIFNPKKALNRVIELNKNVKEYSIEAYDIGGRYQEKYDIKNDDGFCSEYYHCYSDAVRLLEQGYFYEASKAFDLLYEIIYNFNKYNDMNDYGSFYFEIFVDEGMIEIDLNKMKSLRGYSALMSPKRDDSIYSKIFEMILDSYGKATIKSIINAGSTPIPDIENVLNKWISFLRSLSNPKTDKLIAEADELLRQL